jgi:hypothetical protein
MGRNACSCLAAHIGNKEFGNMVVKLSEIGKEKREGSGYYSDDSGYHSN